MCQLAHELGAGIQVATQDEEAGVGGAEVDGVVAAQLVLAVVAEDVVDMVGVVALAGVMDMVEGLIPIPHQWYVCNFTVVHMPNS